MNRITSRIKRQLRRSRSVRKRIFGVPSRPRLTITRTGKHIYAQLIDDTSSRTLCAASTIEKSGRLDSGDNRSAAKEIGIQNIVSELNKLAQEYGEFYKPDPLLESMI